MSGTCMHGFAPDSCLICRTLGAGDVPATQVATAPGAQMQVEAQPVRQRGRLSRARPDAVYPPPAAPARHHRRLAGSLVLVVMGLLAVGAAAWILTAVVFTILHVLELVAVGVGSGWVGYKIGHFRGSRHPRSRA